MTPVLAWWREPSPVFVRDPAEVASVHRVPLSELLDPANRLRVRHPLGYVGPAFTVSGMLVWGFTAMVLDRLLAARRLGDPLGPRPGRGPAPGHDPGGAVSVIDLLLLVAVLGFAVSGYRQGFVVGVLSLTGFLVGGSGRPVARTRAAR